MNRLVFTEFSTVEVKIKCENSSRNAIDSVVCCKLWASRSRRRTLQHNMEHWSQYKDELISTAKALVTPGKGLVTLFFVLWYVSQVGLL